MFPVVFSACLLTRNTSGYEYCRIDGNTPHDTRQDLIEEYNAKVRVRLQVCRRRERGPPVPAGPRVGVGQSPRVEVVSTPVH